MNQENPYTPPTTIKRRVKISVSIFDMLLMLSFGISFMFTIWLQKTRPTEFIFGVEARLFLQWAAVATNWSLFLYICSRIKKWAKKLNRNQQEKLQ